MSLVAIIVVFIILHSPRIISSVAEFYFLTMPNNDEIALQLGHGVPMWLKFLGPINELCTVLNACLNIIIYRYLNCSGVLRYCLMCAPSCFRTTHRTEPPSQLPIATEHRTNTPLEEHEVQGRTDISGSSATASISPGNIASKENEPRNSSEDTLTLDTANQTVTFRAQCHEH